MGHNVIRRLTKIITSAFVATVVGTAHAEPAHETIVPEGWERAYEGLHYAPAVKAGDFLILSGVVAGLGPDDDNPAHKDEEAAYVRAFEAISNILAASGATWAQVIELETFHTDLPAQIDTFAKVKDRYIREPYPTWTAIDIDRLYPDRGLVEIKITAYIGETEKN
ncbi:MAG: Rid family hydrolase [Pseudomonadota bacterium]